MQPPLLSFSQEDSGQSPNRLPPAIQVMNVMNGVLAFHAIRVAARYNLAGILEEHGSLTVAQLAEKTGTHAPSLFRLLRALASIGIFRQLNSEQEDVLAASFGQTDLSRALVPGLPDSMYDIALLFDADWQQDPWRVFDKSIATGEAGLKILTGQDPWQYLGERPAEREQFQRALNIDKAYILLPLGLIALVLLLQTSSITAPLAALIFCTYTLLVLYLWTINPLFNFLLKRGWLK